MNYVDELGEPPDRTIIRCSYCKEESILFKNGKFQWSGKLPPGSNRLRKYRIFRESSPIRMFFSRPESLYKIALDAGEDFMVEIQAAHDDAAILNSPRLQRNRAKVNLYRVARVFNLEVPN